MFYYILNIKMKSRSLSNFCIELCQFYDNVPVYEECSNGAVCRNISGKTKKPCIAAFLCMIAMIYCNLRDKKFISVT